MSDDDSDDDYPDPSDDEFDEYEDERAALRGTSECDGLCSPQCRWCIVAHDCATHGDGMCPYDSLLREDNERRVKAAIRRFTVDIDNGDTPNGPTESAIQDVCNILNSKFYFANPKESRRKLIEAFSLLTASLAHDTKELREAADAYFGEDFTKE